MASEARKKAAQEQLFDGRFLLDDVIGRGRQSIVYRAEQLEPPTPLQRIVALKLIFGGNKDPDGVSRRVRREALGMLAARSEHTIRLFDYLITSEQPYLVMEFAERGDLKAYATHQGGSLEFREALDFVIQALRGLSAVHRSGMIHRDIKAENLLLTGQRGVKIADFSIASVPNEYLSLEKANPVIGTFDYLAPESLTDGICSTRSDLYAMAMTLYELITGIYPFGDGPFSEQVSKKLAGDWTPLPAYINPVPPFLPELFRVGLANRPEDRFASAEEFIDTLEALRSGTWRPPVRLQEHVRIPAPDIPPPQEEETPDADPVGTDRADADFFETPPRTISKRLIAILCFLAGIIAAAIFAGPKLLSLISKSQTSPSAASSEKQAKEAAVVEPPPEAAEPPEAAAPAAPPAQAVRPVFAPTFSLRMAQYPGLPAFVVVSVEAGANALLQKLVLEIENERWVLPLVAITDSPDAWGTFPTPEKSFSLTVVAEQDGKHLLSPPMPIDIDCQSLSESDGEDAAMRDHPLLSQAILLASRVDLLALSYNVAHLGPAERDAPGKLSLPPFPKGPGAHRFSCLMANPNSKLLSLKSEKLQQLMELRTNKAEILEKQLAEMRTKENFALLNERAEKACIAEGRKVFLPELSPSAFNYRLAILGAAEDSLRRK